MSRTPGDSAQTLVASGQADDSSQGLDSGTVLPSDSDADLVSAVRSLYRDGLKPYGRILKKRLAERGEADDNSAEASSKQLRARCEACPSLFVRDGDGADWAALLKGCSEAFVDMYSRVDSYPQDMWQQLAANIGDLDDTTFVLPGGRYSCAQALMERRLDFLAEYSLGQICHIVQLALCQKKILGYSNGRVCAYASSPSKAKELIVKKQADLYDPQKAFVLWSEVRMRLQQLLETSMSREIPISKLKRLFRTKFNVEFSEIALGYTRLSDCLDDPRLRDLCEVKMGPRGYVIVVAAVTHRRGQGLPQSAPSNVTSFSRPSAPGIGTKASGSCRERREMRGSREIGEGRESTEPMLPRQDPQSPTPIVAPQPRTSCLRVPLTLMDLVDDSSSRQPGEPGQGSVPTPASKIICLFDSIARGMSKGIGDTGDSSSEGQHCVLPARNLSNEPSRDATASPSSGCETPPATPRQLYLQTPSPLRGGYTGPYSEFHRAANAPGNLTDNSSAAPVLPVLLGRTSLPYEHLDSDKAERIATSRWS